MTAEEVLAKISTSRDPVAILTREAEALEPSALSKIGADLVRASSAASSDHGGPMLTPLGPDRAVRQALLLVVRALAASPDPQSFAHAFAIAATPERARVRPSIVSAESVAEIVAVAKSAAALRDAITLASEDDALLVPAALVAQEMARRGKDPRGSRGLPVVMARLLERGDSLGSVPPVIDPLETRSIDGGVSPFGPGRRQPAADVSLDTPLAAIELDDDARVARAGEPFEAFEQFGAWEAVFFTLPRALKPEELGPRAIASLALASAGSEAEAISVSASSAEHAFTALFVAGSGGGAYGSEAGNARGRVYAWRSLAALCGAPEGAIQCGEIANLARARTWRWFESGSRWFHQIAWDLGLASLSADGRSLAILAATSTD